MSDRPQSERQNPAAPLRRGPVGGSTSGSRTRGNPVTTSRTRSAGQRENNFSLLMGLFRQHLFLLLVPMGLFASAAAAYVLMRQPVWKATQSLQIRDEMVMQNDLSGRFESLDTMKMVQETLHETVRRHAVVAKILKQVAPPPNYDHAEQWPSIEDIESMQGSISLNPPNGAPFGRTEILLLSVEDATVERAMKIVELLGKELQVQANELRDKRAASIETELSESVRLATSELEISNGKIAEFEKGLGEVLVDLRAISNDTGSGSSALQNRLNEILTESRVSRQRYEALSRQRERIRLAKDDPDHVLSFTSDLLAAQPALQKLKEELIRIQSQNALVLGQFAPHHAKAKAALESERVVKTKIVDEIIVAEQGLIAQTETLQDQIIRQAQAKDQVEAKLEKLAELRAPYSALLKTVNKKREILDRSLEDLARARAARAAAKSTQLITLLDAPYSPSRPEGLSKKLVVGVAGLAGLLSGVGLVFFAASPSFIGPLGYPDQTANAMPAWKSEVLLEREFPRRVDSETHRLAEDRQEHEREATKKTTVSDTKSRDPEIRKFDFDDREELDNDLEVMVNDLHEITSQSPTQTGGSAGPNVGPVDLESLKQKSTRPNLDVSTEKPEESSGKRYPTGNPDSGTKEPRTVDTPTEFIDEDEWQETQRRKIERMFRDDE